MNNEEKILMLLEGLTATVAKQGEQLAKHGERLEEMQETLTRVAVTQEGVVLPRLQALYEGHEAIMEQLKKKADNDRMYELAGDVPMMKDSIKRLRTDVNELKKAQ